MIDATSSNFSRHHFVTEEEAMKEVSLEEMFQTIYKNDFNETSTIILNSRVMKDAEKVFSEDRRFFQIVEKKTTKAGEHYVVPLPFRNESLEMQKTRQGMERLMYFKERFKRNSSYIVDYKKFMDDLITKGYARSKIQDHRERLGLSYTMGCITQASLGKSEWSLIAEHSLMNNY